MDLNDTAEQQAFRREVRAFLAAELPPALSHKVQHRQRLGKEDTILWQGILHKRGWGAPGWPKSFGGTGWSAIEQHIFEEEAADAGAPRQLDFGLRMVAPVIMAFGNKAQQERFLPRILSGEDWWCQGYSEPGAGSDLASLRTRAERKGQHYVVNGQKAWTTLGQHADWIFCLVRTSTEGRPQEGISFLLIDMKSPGITVRPTIMLDGEHEVNETYFDDVEVPVENLVGEENRGWTYAKFLLGHERTGLANVGQWKRLLKRLEQVARRETASSGRPLIEDARFRDKLAQLKVDLLALEVTLLRVLSAEAKDAKKGLGPVASVLKIKGTEIGQAIFELTMQACGHDALAYLPEALEPGYSGPRVGGEHAAAAAGDYFNMRKLSIFGGSNEIQRNIISQMLLGL
ncbi:acyl-CoA dehydrogenase family protein [Pyxidicoccus xibeiensis]|uniref:acyl-CoA dehydrogenase family protein n=1 Tax=Pyxidicoccus xibeiensis TaxID=2906759 RepID=UPI0020A8192A|nr:acyl-CoA dehydrogenase family protein [Pyxidicoccus xibeiensis]MCP3138276.1 acyl-CoA dehydrogenase family protein [Pyxidicoccus xibeiensis]